MRCDTMRFILTLPVLHRVVSMCVSVFKSEAPILSLDSARAAIADWGGDLLSITHVVAVTCTGVIVPGLEFQILTGLGLAANTQRLSVTFMGCFGALSGMKAARAFAMERSVRTTREH